jgi:hypothetical protein
MKQLVLKFMIRQKMVKIDKTIAFKTNEHYGNLFQAYPFASPALKSGVEMLDVSFTGIVKTI